MKNEILSNALEYAVRGWAVLPVHGVNNGKCSCGKADCPSPGKHPMIQLGVGGASKDPSVIRSWFEKRYPKANVGIAAGEISGIIVLDIDGEQGEVSLTNLQKKNGTMPNTLSQRTGKGRHLVFKYPEGRITKNKIALLPGLDIKTDGGLVVAAPSTHVNGKQYEWVDYNTPLAQCPDCLINLISEPNKKKTITWNKNIPEGQRNDDLTRKAGSLFRQGLNEEVVLKKLLKYNKKHCKPPLPQNEVENIVKSIAGRKTEHEPKHTTQAAWLTHMALEHATFFYDKYKDAYVIFTVDNHKETWKVRSRECKEWLIQMFYTEFNKPPGNHALQDTLSVLEAKAKFEGGERMVYIRTAEHNGNIYLDLCNEDWEVVEITKQGWKVISDCPVMFRRTKGMQALPKPNGEGSIGQLRKFVNVGSEEDFNLLVSVLISYFRPRGSYPLLVLQGQQGSAKSTTARILRDLIDPNAAPLRGPPKNSQDLAIASKNNWILIYDNLSFVKEWLSDGLSRISTGGGYGTRTLYTDDEETIIDYTRPIIINGIGDIIDRHDILDRSVIFTLPPIRDDHRRAEENFWADFNQAKPYIISGLLEAVVIGLQNIDMVEIKKLPRMADYAKWSIATAPAYTTCDNFMAVYDTNQKNKITAALDSCPISSEIMNLVTMQPIWEGTANNLLDELTRKARAKGLNLKFLPKNASWLIRTIKRSMAFLHNVGVNVEFYHNGQRRYIKISKIPKR